MKLISPTTKTIRTICFTAVSLISLQSYAYFSAVADGPWSAPATWEVGRAPDNNDTLIIPAGITITVDINSPVYSNMEIYVFGTLNFENGQKINMCPGGMIVFDGGQLTGGTPGSKINICGETVWNGPGPSPGPIYFDQEVRAVVDLVASSQAAKDVGVFRIGITWTTPFEETNTSFDIERSNNGFTFEKIGTVEGKGVSAAPQSFSFTDEHPEQGTNYYRVLVTRTGKEPVTSEKMAAATISEETKGCVLNVYPNPCVEECQVRFSDCPSDNDGTIVVEMVDANGNTVSSTTPQRDANGAFSMTIDASNNLAPGMYIVRGTSAKKSYMQKAILK